MKKKYFYKMAILVHLNNFLTSHVLVTPFPLGNGLENFISSRGAAEEYNQGTGNCVVVEVITITNTDMV